MLHGTALARAVSAHRRRWRETRAAVGALADGLAAAGREVDGARLRRNAAWAFDMYWSRAIEVPGAAQGSGTVGAMVPVADMANHDPASRMRWDSSGSDAAGCITLRASAALAPGSAVRIPYGAESSAELAARFGFTLPRNPAEAALLPGADGQSHWIHRAALLPEGFLPAARAAVAAPASAAPPARTAAAVYAADGWYDATTLDWTDPATLALDEARVLPLGLCEGDGADREREALDGAVAAVHAREQALAEVASTLRARGRGLAGQAVEEEAALVGEAAALLRALRQQF